MEQKTTIIVVPAYGVTLLTKEEVQNHWENERDFLIHGISPYAGRYIAKHEAEKHNLLLEVHYGRWDEKRMILG